MNISIGNDHAGVDLKETIILYLESKGHMLHNHGTNNGESVDYADFIHPVAQDLEDKTVDMGIVICGSGNGAANKENSADLIGGVSIEDKDNVLAQVILDLSQSATIETSIKASSILLAKLGKVSKLHSKNIEQAGFVVLKSPDIPSILVETAFLSNSKEEKKLRTKKFQNNIAKALRDGIVEIIRKGII